MLTTLANVRTITVVMKLQESGTQFGAQLTQDHSLSLISQNLRALVNLTMINLQPSILESKETSKMRSTILTLSQNSMSR